MMKRLILIALLFSGPSLAGEFQSTLDAGSDAVRKAHPEIAAHVDGMIPIENRAGMLFFPGRHLVDPSAQLLIQDRLLKDTDTAAVRVALAYALNGAHRLPWSVIVDQPAPVRRALLSGYKKAGHTDAQTVFAGALADPSVQVRMEAARLIGYRADLVSPALSAGLNRGLADASPEVRSFSVRAISWRTEDGGFDAIRPLLNDASASVREAAVRALGKLDPDRAASLEAVRALASDNDPGVGRAVRRVLGGG
jgi:HEAT repeat protein